MSSKSILPYILALSAGHLLRLDHKIYGPSYSQMQRDSQTDDQKAQAIQKAKEKRLRKARKRILDKVEHDI